MVASREIVSEMGKDAREVAVSEMSPSTLAASSSVGNAYITSPIRQGILMLAETEEQ